MRYRSKTNSAYFLMVTVALCLSSPSASQAARRVTLIGAKNIRVVIEVNSPTLPPNIDAKSLTVLIDGGPVTLCARQNYGNPCIRIRNKRVFCDLDNCFSGAGDWRNRIRSVRFDKP